MKNVIVEKRRILEKWTNLIFAYIVLTSLFSSLVIIWLNHL